MRKILLFNAIVISSFYFSQTTIFSENFENSSTLSGWLGADRDRDGYNWELVSGSDSSTALAGWGGTSGTMAASFAYQLFPGSKGPLDVDNLLVSPAIQIPADGESELSFKIGVHLDTMDDHNYQLFILEDGQEFFPTLTPTISRNFKGTKVAQIEKVDLAQFKGKKVRLYFRHLNSFEQFVLLLDDILIANKPVLATEEISKDNISIYPNPASSYLNIKGIKKNEPYEILDFSGRLVAKGLTNSSKIEVSYLSAGTYFLVLKNYTSAKLKFIKK